ncbi:hypothetical protein BGW42_005808 [Actinomortierella wolfii]|nr:hypothetical protein BGW42_005808 [Actinomortierella wolfii]
MDRQLRIMDRRHGGDFEAMLLTEAHRGAIRDIQWNPYVPYWLASCGDDGQIKVWDLRFQSRAMVEMGEYGQGFYQSLAWSNVHCDIISSSSRDRAFQVWKLGVQWSLDEDEAKSTATGTGAVRPRSARVRPLSGGHMVGASGGISSSAATAAMTLELAKLGTLRRSEQDISSLSTGSQSSSLLSPYHSVLPTSNKAASESYHKVITGSQVAIVRDMSDASIVQILPSNQDPSTFLTITSAGILATHTLRSSTLDTLAPHRDPSNTFSREYGIERSLYHRNLTDVCHQLLDWVRSGENESSDKKAKAKRMSGDKTGKDDHSYPPINPREMLDTMTRLPPAGLSSQSWTLPSSSNPSTPSSPSYPADQLQVPHHHDSGSAVTRRRRFSAQIFSTDRSRSRSPSISSVNSDSASSTDRKLEPAHLAAFIKDFEQYTLLQLPPAFPLQLANQPLPSDLELQIANVAKREELVRLSRDHQAQALVDRLDEISDIALRDPLNMDIASLCQILSCVMDWDHVQGLRMARTLVGCLSSQSSSSTTCTDAALSKGESAQWWPLVHMAMFPTIFDRSMVHCGPESYEAYKAVRASGCRQMLERFTLTSNESKRRSFTSLKTPVLQDFETAQDYVARSGSIATILDMLDFEIQVQSHLAQEPHVIPAHIVLELFHPTEYQGCKMTISQQAMSIYFEATSATGQWGDYFETLERLLCNFSYVLLDNQGQPNGWFASSIKAMEEAILESSSLLAQPPTFHHQGSPSTTIVASPMSMSNGSGSVSSSWPPSASSGDHVTSPSSSLCPPPALVSHFLWAHFDLYGLPALREQVERLLDQPPQALMQTHPIVLESWILALGRLIKVWWGGEKVSSVAKCDSDNHLSNVAGVENITIMAAVLGGAPMAKMVLNRRQLEFQFDTVAGRFFQRISVGSNNPEQTREIAERQANALMDQLRSNGLLKRKNQSENPVPEADRLYQALLRFLRAGFIEQPVQV